MLHRQLKLVINEEVCAIEATTQTGAPQVLSISRSSFEVSLVNHGISGVPATTIHGIIGTVRLNAGLHLIVITQVKKVGQIKGQDVFRITGAQVHNLGRDKGRGAHELSDDQVYVKMLESVLAEEFWFFSYDYDLSRSVQNSFNTPADSKTLPMWKRFDDRFFWNKYLQQDLIAKAKDNPEFNSFILPVMLGFVSINPSTIRDTTFDYVLITRKSYFRAGTRYNTRGVDVDGNVANFNETEQIVISPKGTAAYLQTRGSIPLFWRQNINVKYQPEMVVEPVAEAMEAFKSHFRDQVSKYGDQIVVNLVNQKGYELKVFQAFGKAVNEHGGPEITYVPFDFHHECKGMKFENINKMISQISGQLEKQGYFVADQDGKITKQQQSVVRTNCIDCLDRTNVAQAALARRALLLALKELNILQPADTLESNPVFDRMLKNVWADNADAVSFLYSGTGALKTDFTRLGKRTTMGAVQDGINSGIRYVKNNYLDGFRQDSLDLFLGNYRVRPSVPSPFTNLENNDEAIRRFLVPALLFLALLMVVVSLVVPTEEWLTKIFFLVFWAAIAFLSYQSILKYPAIYVNTPKLYNPLLGKNSRADPQKEA